MRCLSLAMLLAAPAFAQVSQEQIARPVVLMTIIGAISLAPFLAIMLTSFVKVSIVLSLVKSALGSQVPAGMVTNGLAIILTIFIMAPVGERMYAEAHLSNAGGDVFATKNLVELYDAADRAKEPLRDFLLKHAAARDRALFVSLSQRLNAGAPGQGNAAPAPAEAATTIPPDREFKNVLPAFVIGELKNSFQVGFLILLPFVIVDIVVANILVALSLQLQPAIVSLPVKILLFVVADGWFLIVKGLVLSYA